MKSKWKIKGYPKYVFGENKKLYRLPYTKDNRSFQLREIKIQKGNRYRLTDRNEWLSQKSIIKRNLLYLDNNPVYLFVNDDCPF